MVQTNWKRRPLYVLLGEPGSIYLDHITVTQETGSKISEGIRNSAEEMGLELQSIKAIGVDSTAVNTGRRNGAIHLLEASLGRSLQWTICNLHLIALPLRHLCKNLIGPTTSSTQWRGLIGKDLAMRETFALSSGGIKCIVEGPPLPEFDVAELSHDQAYLYRIIVRKKWPIRPGLQISHHLNFVRSTLKHVRRQPQKLNCLRKRPGRNSEKG